jgi:transcriptional regulator with XRE-family HTH domain
MGWGNVAEAATECGLPVGSWRNWERDGREPRGFVNVCMKIAGVTGVDLNWLMMGPTAQQDSDRDRAGVTHGYTQYHPIGERIIIVGTAPPTSGASSDVRTDVRKGVRARPLER